MSNVVAEFTINQPQTIETEFQINVDNNDHNNLINRDLDDQHPISAITGLQEALDSVQSSWGHITGDIDDQIDLKNALNAKQDVISDLSEIRSGAEKGETALQPNDNVSELVNDAGYITDSSLPTVNNATLTIQKNNVSVGTFTANASSDTTINITVPTTASDVSALPSNTKYGASLSLSINSSTYVITAQLKDQDGNNLGSAQTIDLPLESVVVSGSYDDETKKIILTLQNGSTVEFSVADLVSGLQTEITSNNKLNADLVDDSTSTNKFVTSSEKSAISTAVQPADLATVATSGSYNDLLNKPTIPTVNNATLTIQKNGVDVQTFTANASTNATANITVPTDTGDLTNGAGFITGITSGDVTTALGYTPYSDANPNGYTSNVGTVTSVNNTSPDGNGNVTLSIPTVNNATISFTQGGVSKGSITLNQATDQTIALDAGGGGGGGSYTAGDGIIIQNDEISVDAEATNEVDVESITEVTISDLLKLITGYDANATQTLKNINGSIQWVTD